MPSPSSFVRKLFRHRGRDEGVVVRRMWKDRQVKQSGDQDRAR